nr:MAG TPA: helix-turn-helix domain protein [Caudoviricetes sp.]
MSYAAERWARAQRVGNARAKQVLVELANCHNGKTGKCTPGIKYLHEVTELKEDTISTATNFLQSKGFIKKTYVAVEKGRAISYELLGFNPQEWERKKTEDSTENGLTQNRGNPESVGTPETGATGTPEFGGETGNKNRERNREVLRAPSGAPQPPEMSDDEIADLLESVPQEKGERPPFEKGAHLSEKGDHPSPAPKRKRVSNVQKPESVSEQVWEDFSALRTKRRAPITETALRGIQREAEKAGISLEAALSTCCERGWQGFKAEWYRREKLERKNASKAEYQLPSNDDWDNYDASHYA